MLTISVHHYIHSTTADAKLDDILSRLRALQGEGRTMSKELDDLRAEVERDRTVDESAITLLNGLSAQIAAQKDDPVALAKLAEDLKGQSDALAAAVAANTPAAPPA